MHKITKFAVFFVSAAIAISHPSLAKPADCVACGDANGDGVYTVADIAYITAFLYAGGPAPAECADIDGYDLITIRDVIMGGTMASPLCVTQPKIVAQPTSLYEVRYPMTVPANVSSHNVTVSLWNTISVAGYKIKGFDLPLLIKIDGQIPLSLTASTAGSNWPSGELQLTIDSASGIVLVSALNGSVGYGYYDLFDLTIAVAPSPNSHLITLEYAEMAPTMTGIFAPPNSACHYVMVLDSNLNAWKPSIDPLCRCGDADNNGFWSISDVVFIINHIFAGGPPPLMVCLADADVNGIETISDAVFLIGYIFAGAPQPGGC